MRDLYRTFLYSYSLAGVRNYALVVVAIASILRMLLRV